LAIQREHADEAEAQPVPLGRRVHDPAEHVQRGRRDRARGGVVREPGDAAEHPVDEELGGQRRHREVEALDPQARDAEGEADERREAAGEQEGDDQRDLGQAQRQVVGGVGAHRHEGAGAERDLAAVADQQVQADGAQGQDQEGHHDRAQEVVAGEQRDDEPGDRQDRRDPEPVQADAEDRLVGGVGGAELAGLAVDHVPTPAR
jgi:hypothetical protein